MQGITNKYCLNLDLGIDFNNSLIKSLSVDSGNINHFTIDTDPVLQEFLLQFDVKIVHSELFYTPPGYTLYAHIDSLNDDHCKLNFVYGGAGSQMQWWQFKNPNTVLKTKTNSIGTEYIPVDVNDCDLIWSAEVGVPGLINAGQPHSVTNSNIEPRWSFSHVLANVKKKWLLQWDDAVAILKPYMLEQKTRHEKSK